MTARIRLPAGYTTRDAERWLPEPPKDPRRGVFARDRARVVHSSALRRLAAKTQVVSPETDDFVRNRLTHSLEVAQVGRELGQLLGCDPDVVDTACLAHDLGHPPFGHNGEAALDQVAARIGGFEGNAQTLRLLTLLEPKVVDPVTGGSAGLNLTRASLDACTKYPWTRGAGPAGPASAKFGAYREDEEVFGWLRVGAPPGRRCVEAQVMDLADDVAYSVHDVEDAVVGGDVDPRWLADPGQVAAVEEQVRSWYLADLADGEIAAAIARLLAMPAWVGAFDRSLRARAALKDMTSQLIGRFIGAVERATRERYGGGRLTRYAADVVVPRDTLLEIAALKGVAAHWVMTAARRQRIYSEQRHLLVELADVLARKAPDALEPPYASAWTQAHDDPGRLRSVIDQIASLTDAGAIAWHRSLGRDHACRS
ncbi:MAG TPA: deoxyguanosinetriphosphate triphosphohydrolase [Kineosporiaceae bacterium]